VLRASMSFRCRTRRLWRSTSSMPRPFTKVVNSASDKSTGLRSIPRPVGSASRPIWGIACAIVWISTAAYCSFHTQIVAAVSLRHGHPTSQSEDQRNLTAGQRARAVICGHCIICHNDGLKNGNLSFEHRETALRGGTLGPAVVPGEPEKSMMVHAIRRDGKIAEMMPPGPKLPDEDIEGIVEWVSMGAPWSVDPIACTRPVPSDTAGKL
jgi:mono/diheme cytochrome c family protein